ncbi:MAG: hypothetical protein KY447_09345 [Actinobacteria bacterium]|nr:hypothetical protein [Actinomycetota bacterium]
MPEPLTPSGRSLRARIGGYARAAKHDSTAMTAAARANGPGSIEYWEAKVDPTGELAADDRRRRAEAAKHEHYARLAFASAKARRKAAS